MSESRIVEVAPAVDRKRVSILEQARAIKNGSLRTVGSFSDGLEVLSFYGKCAGVAFVFTGITANVFNFDDATNFFGQVGVVVGALGFGVSHMTEKASRAVSRTMWRLAKDSSTSSERGL